MEELPAPIDSQIFTTVVSDFNEPMSRYFLQLNLPVDDVLYPVEDRAKVFNSFESAIKDLPEYSGAVCTTCPEFGNRQSVLVETTVPEEETG